MPVTIHDIIRCENEQSKCFLRERFMIKCAFTWKWYKKVLKMHKKFFAIRIWKRKAPETLFFATMIFKYGKMILNWFTFLHVINAFALISFRAIKIHFSVQKDDDDIFLMEIASLILLTVLLFRLYFLIYLFLMAAFRHLARAKWEDEEVP